MTKSYLQHVRETILPLSIAGDLPDVFEEWKFTGNTEDYIEPTEECELCGKQELRYHFEIKNDYTDHLLNVGSKCILRFNIPVYVNGELLTTNDAKKHLDKLTQQMRLDSCLSALEELARRETNPILSNALEYFREHKKLTPKFAFVVFWKLRQYRIDHHPSFFSIKLNRQRFVRDLKEMTTERVHFFWSALSPSQQKKAIEMGHTPPTK